jgi:hypothetical protein
VRGLAAAYLHEGADHVYLFNYMDSQTAMDDNEVYGEMLKEIGDPARMAEKSRRHVVTYTDTWAPGERPAHRLPVEARAGQWIAVRQAVGSDAARYRAALRIGVRGGDAAAWTVRVNGEQASFTVRETGLRPGPDTPVWRFACAAALRGPEEVVELLPASGGTLEWVEILLEPR